MDLTVIIVNFNVKHFLYQCLNSVLQASKDLDVQIIVVDNNSSDGSMEMVASHFPSVERIANKENVGFATANNQGISIAKGDYTLLLNPDTIVRESTFTSCIHYYKRNEDTAGLGIRMIDGSGQFLPESKRSFPSPDVAFYKLFGLSKLFPKSHQFGKYHLTYLSETETNPVDVLSGAFLMAKTSDWHAINGLDETFFMYGEDIDVSYRLQQNGKQNVYFAGDQIIHYKGESTKRHSIHYIKNFYEAMVIFAQKHYQGQKANSFIFIMKLAIMLRGILAYLNTVFKRWNTIIFDLLLSFGLMVITKELWEHLKDFSNYPKQLITINFPIYLLIFFGTIYLSGGYDKPYRFSKLAVGTFFGFALNSIIYAFLPEELRFSRALILLSAIAVLLAFTIVRVISQYLTNQRFDLSGSHKRRVVIVGSDESKVLTSEKIIPAPQFQFLGFLSRSPIQSDERIGSLSDLSQVCKTLSITDVIFDADELSYSEIVDGFSSLHNCTIKLHTSHSKGKIIITSHSKDESGTVFLKEQHFLIQQPKEKRKKRLLDIVFSLIALLLFPIFFIRQQQPIQYLKNIWSVLTGKKTWVGYSDYEHLPTIKPSILNVSPKTNTTASIQQELAEDYAKYYSIYEDIEVIQQQFNNLSNSSA